MSGSEISWYYLHTNGELIHKCADPSEDVSDFVRRVWTVDIRDRATAWRLLLEASALGANLDRVRELAMKWGCHARDLTEYLRRNIEPSPEQRRGLRVFLGEVLHLDPDLWFDWLAKTEKGRDPDFETMPASEAP